jgi:DNA-binding protein YbaB
MFNPLQGISDLKKMRDQAMNIQNALKKITTTVEKHGVKIMVRGDQHIESIESNGKSDNDIREAVNEAIKKSQEEAAKYLAANGGLGGMFGGK